MTSPLQAGSRDQHVTQVVSVGMSDLLAADTTGTSHLTAAVRCAERYAADGAPLDLFVRDLEACLQAMGRGRVDAAMLRATSIAWADAYAVRYVDLGCEDHDSGFASVQHLQSHVLCLPSRRGTLRGVVRRSTSWVLIVVDLDPHDASRANQAVLDRALRQSTRPGDVVAALAAHRRAVLVPRGKAAARLLELESCWAHHRPSDLVHAHLWIEGLPDDPRAASLMIDELCR